MRKTKVTGEMLREGQRVFDDISESVDSGFLVSEIYISMDRIRQEQTELAQPLGTSIGIGLMDRLKFGAEVIARMRNGETEEGAISNTLSTSASTEE